MGAITLFTTSEYEAQEFDAILIRDKMAICVQADQDQLRLVPMDKVNHVDGDAEQFLAETEIPESFYGGAERGFVDIDQFPEIEAHLKDLESEEY